ncbi:YggU family protein [Desulfonema ishimotonii]|uniref:UPF0235 protein DENIS_3804 n=1 Tax=Desulfonema ishimotonii TaxID=45657 RepID=A0A401G0S4_9BACT|nr:YggU family protein [Desulfonema ishimotonii]
MLWTQEKENGLSLRIFVQPKSSKNMVVGLHGDALKVKLTAPPVDGAANKMCVKFLAKSFGLSKSSVEILSGHTGRTKQVLLQGRDADELERLRGVLKKMIHAGKTP